MFEVRQIGVFSRWLCAIGTHEPAFWRVSSDWRWAIPAMSHPWEKAFQSFGSITAQIIGSISSNMVRRRLSCWPAATSARRAGISRQRSASHGRFRGQEWQV
jgi:hypothetical protein